MIISTIVVVAYVGFNVVSSDLTGGVSSGAQYDQLNELKSEYSSLESKFEDMKSNYYIQNNPDLQQKYVDAEVYLVQAKNNLDNVDSALSIDAPSEEVDSRMEEAKVSLKQAKKAYNSL